MLAVGTLLMWIFPKSKSAIFDIFASVAITAVIIAVITLLATRFSLLGNVSLESLHSASLLVSGLFLISFFGVSWNYMKYPTLFNYSMSITLFILAFTGVVHSFSDTVTDTPATAAMGLTMLAYLIGAIGSLTDVGQIFNEYVRSSERLKAANQELQKYEVYLEKVPDPILITDEKGLTLYVNPAFEESFGFSLSEVKEKGPYDIYDSTDRENAEQYLERVNEGKGGGCELAILRRDGQRIETLLNSALIVIDGRSLGRITIFRDITERKLLEDRNQVLSAAVENTDESISLTDPGGRVTYLNSAAENLFGYTLDSLPGGSLWTLVSPSFGYSKAREIYVKTVRSGSWKGEVLNRRKDGTEYYISLSTSSIKDNEGKVIALVGVCEDITEKKWESKRKEALYRVAQMAISSERLSELAQSATVLFAEILQAPLVVIYFFDEKNATLELVASHDLQGRNIRIPMLLRLKANAGTDAVRTVRSRRMLFSDSLSKTEFAEFAADPVFQDSKGLVSVPLISSGELIGVVQYLTLAAAGSVKHEMDLADVAAAELAVGVQRLKLVTKIAEQADQLEKIFAGATEGILLVNRLGKILLLNEAAKRFSGSRISRKLPSGNMPRCLAFTN